MNNIKNGNRSIFKKLVRYSLSALLIVLILLSSAFFIFSIYKDDIARQIVLQLNERRTGEITLEEISLNPFKYFPDVTLKLSGVKYYRQKTPVRPDSVQPVIDLNNFYFALGIIDLLKGRLNVKELSLNSGRINLIKRKDGSIDIVNALGLSDSSQTDESAEEEKELIISADKIELVDLYTRLESKANASSIEFYISSLDASLAVGGELERIALNTDIVLISYSTPAGEFLRDHSIQLDAKLFYKEEASAFEFKNSRFVFDRAEFEMSGFVDIESGGNLDLKISGSDKDFSFLSLVLQEDAILKNRKYLKEGNVYFDGSVRGNISEGIPFAEFTFGMNNVRLDIPAMNNSIKDLNLTGYFTTGTKQNLSEAELLLENFSADLPDGSTNGTIRITNFENPKLEFDFYLKTDITGYDKIFKIDELDSLGGVITIAEKLNGSIDKDKRRIVAGTAAAEIEFENVSVNFPGEISLDKINGKVKRANDRYILEDLSIISKNTDVTVNGFADNILFLLFDVESDISADLRIKSNRFVFPEVFSFDTAAAKSFPYTIKDLDISVEAKTTIEKLHNFDDFPDVDFSVKSMDAAFDDLPDIQNLSGEFSMFEDPSSFNIKFDDLALNTANGKLTLNGLYTGAENLPLYLKTDLSIDNLDLPEFIAQIEGEVDSTSVFNKISSGSMHAEIQFSREEIVFETFLLDRCDLEFNDKIDSRSVMIKSMTMNFKDVNYNLDINSNPLATLFATGRIKFGEFSTPEFILEESANDISVSNGRYKVITLKSSMFGQKGEGVFEFEPWAELPDYKLTYSVKQFEITRFFETFLEDTVLTGNMDLSLNISMKGDDWENMLSHLNGNISLTGSNLTLHGLDVDKLLERVARSQNFNLLDVSAVILAGPVGLAVTKGTDIASIVILSPGEKTTLPQLVSIWDMKNGNLQMTDIAFSTKNHRIVSKGYINLVEKNLDVTIAEVNEKGCIILSQTVSGNLEDPETGDLKVLESLLSPVTNLFNSITGKECEVFYDGSVEHPK